ncbi:succinate--CoA ligase subunit alpha [Zavarzinia sp. CC-PAN008]|uniref:succinate--CoA ligase subunit alpha n=1 Tax=Zavarzinia sp. CC-PAN008 TaxID=3243332 RepID=UPI003F746671
MAVLLTAEAQVVAVGATGPYGQAQIAFMRSAGTQIVAAVSPGRGGTAMDGLPVFDTVAEAAAAVPIDSAMIYTPAMGVRDVLVECADAGCRLAVAAAEFVPLHDAMHAISYARARGMWVVGPNTVGIVTPGQAMMGSIAPGFTLPGRVGIIGRSGTLTMTMARLLSARGLGQSTIVHVGGDTIAGGNPHDWLRLFLADPGTDAIVYLGEIGGTKEYAMLDLIRTAQKPVVALVVGRHAPPGKRMGHAGALVGGARETAAAKRSALAAAGARIADDPPGAAALVAQALNERKTA